MRLVVVVIAFVFAVAVVAGVAAAFVFRCHFLLLFIVLLPLGLLLL